MEAVLEVNKKNNNNPDIKRVEIEYGNMEYIIANLEEKVIDIDGVIYIYQSDENTIKEIKELLWEYKDLDEFDYWPDKSKDHPPMSPLWRLSFYDEFETYYHKSGATSYPPKLMNIVNLLKNLEKQK